MNIAIKLSLLRQARELRQSDLASVAGVSVASISQWEAGQRSPKIGAIRKICQHFGIDLTKFLDESNNYYDSDLPNNLTPLQPLDTVPLIGTIACGDPILAIEDASETVSIPRHVRADFALRCKGDSMINARIYDGDIVYIRSQPDVTDGEIAAIIIDGEATLKRVYHLPGQLLLQPENPAYKPFVYTPEDIAVNDIRIIGKAVAFCSLLE